MIAGGNYNLSVSREEQNGTTVSTKTCDSLTTGYLYNQSAVFNCTNQLIDLSRQEPANNSYVNVNLFSEAKVCEIEIVLKGKLRWRCCRTLSILSLNILMIRRWLRCEIFDWRLDNRGSGVISGHFDHRRHSLLPQVNHFIQMYLTCISPTFVSNYLTDQRPGHSSIPCYEEQSTKVERAKGHQILKISISLFMRWFSATTKAMRLRE